MFVGYRDHCIEALLRYGLLIKKILSTEEHFHEWLRSEKAARVVCF